MDSSTTQNLSVDIKSVFIDTLQAMANGLQSLNTTQGSGILTSLKTILKSELLNLDNITIQENPITDLNIDTGITSDIILKAGKIVDVFLSKNIADNQTQDMSDLINYIGLQSIKNEFNATHGITNTFDNFKVIGVRIPYGSSFKGSDLEGSNTSINIPKDSFFNSYLNSSNQISLIYAEIYNDIHRLSNATYNNISEIVRLQIFNGTKELNLTNLSTPITISFNNIVYMQSIACRFFNTSKNLYSKNGVQLGPYNSTGKQVTCLTSHLSDFAVFTNEPVISQSKFLMRISNFFFLLMIFFRFLGKFNCLLPDVICFVLWKSSRFI